MSNLQKRLLLSFVFISIAIYAVFLAPSWVFFGVIEGFILLGLNEYYAMAERKGIVLNRPLGIFFGALLPFSIYFASVTMILSIACLTFFIFNFHRKYREQALVSTAVAFFGLIYVSWFFSFMNEIHALEHGPSWVFYVLLLVKGGDAGAYFIGKRFGKRKLAEHISPNKSVEGAIGGFAVTLGFSFLSKLYLPHVSFIHLLVMGIVVGVLAQLGDLVESLIKRDVGVKDSGQIPGLGGLLDIMDSLLLTVPFVYYYLTLFPKLL